MLLRRKKDPASTWLLKEQFISIIRNFEKQVYGDSTQSKMSQVDQTDHQLEQQFGAEPQARSDSEQNFLSASKAAENLGNVSPVTPFGVLTHHELYELTQQQQQLEPAAIARPAIQSKQSFRNSIHGHRMERQQSIIVGTPGFRERYGK